MATMSVTSLMKELREAEAQAMKYQEYIITTDNERLKTLYNKFARWEEDRIPELQETMDRIRHRKIVAPVDSSDEEEFQ